MSKPLDQTLYKKVKREADKKFEAPTSAYKSSWIVREYKKRGGKYSKRSPKKSKSTGLQRWYREEWVDLNRPIKKNGKVIGYKKCGRKSSKSKGKYPLCRPSKRITKKTPKTYKELSKGSIKRAKSKKRGSKRIKFGKGPGLDQEGGGPQYHGKRSKVMIPVPKGVAREAERAFKMRDQGFKGMHETGWKRAKQLATKESIPIEDLKFMRNWFARHIYTSYPSYKAWVRAGKPQTTEWFNKRGILAWVGWAGDPALRWINSKTKLLNEHYNKDYKKLKL